MLCLDSQSCYPMGSDVCLEAGVSPHGSIESAKGTPWPAPDYTAHWPARHGVLLHRLGLASVSRLLPQPSLGLDVMVLASAWPCICCPASTCGISLEVLLRYYHIKRSSILLHLCFEPLSQNISLLLYFVYEAAFCDAS